VKLKRVTANNARARSHIIEASNLKPPINAFGTVRFHWRPKRNFCVTTPVDPAIALEATMKKLFPILAAAAACTALLGPALAEDALLPVETMACKDRALIDNLPAAMRSTDPSGFHTYVRGLLDSGACQTVPQNYRLVYSANDRWACARLRGECYWTAIQPTSALAVTPSRETTGSASR
jgi:hypothetical protein